MLLVKILKQKENPENKIYYIDIMDRSEYYYEVICNKNPQPCQDLNKQFDCNTRTPKTTYYFDLDAQTGYAQALHSNIVAYNSEISGKEIVNNPMNIINKK